MVCNRGYVDPVTRFSTVESRCLLNERNEGEWIGPIPDACVIVDCGEPPLGVHAYPPQVHHSLSNFYLLHVNSKQLFFVLSRGIFPNPSLQVWCSVCGDSMSA